MIMKLPYLVVFILFTNHLEKQFHPHQCTDNPGYHSGKKVLSYEIAIIFLYKNVISW